MAIQIVTGRTGAEHITADMDGHRLAGTVGVRCVLETRQKLAASFASANVVRLGTGDLLFDGRHCACESVTDIPLVTGTAGYYRTDLIVARYTRTDEGIEAVELASIQGAPSTDAPAQPVYNAGSVLDGDALVDYPLYSVTFDGVTPGDPVALFDYASSLETLGNGRVSTVEAKEEYDRQLAANRYPGRNIAEIPELKDEVAAAGSAWQFLSARAKAENADGLRPFDYFDVTLTDGKVFRYQIGAIAHNRNAADAAQPFSFFMVPTEAWPANILWSETATNQGTSAEDNPYLVSNLHKWELNTFLPLLPATLRNVLIEYRSLVERRYSASSQLTASTQFKWASLGKVFSLSEMEVYGCPVWGTPGWSVGYDSQLPIFRETKNRIRGRVTWWLRVASGSSASDVCNVYSGGYASYTSAANGSVRPLPCFLIG